MKFSRVNSSPYHNWTIEQLSALGTRHLIALLKASKNRMTCGCGPGYHCGDDLLSESDLEFNRLQWELGVRVKQILNSRPHLERNTRARTARNFGGKEKKIMRY